MQGDNRITVWPAAYGGITMVCRDCCADVFLQEAISLDDYAPAGAGFIRLSQLNAAAQAHVCASLAQPEDVESAPDSAAVAQARARVLRPD